MRNREPVTITLRRLFDENHASLRGIAARTRDADEAGKGIHYTYISGVLSGRETPSPRSLELLARVFDVEPELFPEYRLWKMRTALDPRLVGLDAAVEREDELCGEPPTTPDPIPTHR
jgi:transcriptional regulator with XRE-family HTH domain